MKVLDGHALAHRYETLRRGVMQPDAPRQDLRGVALLMRQGLAAWMRSVGEPAPHACAHGAAHTATLQCSSTIEQMLVNIVAAMALSNVVEEITA